MQTFSKGWYVVYTRPQHEKKVAEQLCNNRVENFLPLVKSLKYWSDRRKYVDTPLFPSYVFVKLEDSQSYFRSLELSGILYYVRSGKQIASVNDSVITSLKQAIADPYSEITVSSDCISPGEKFIIYEGPFTGFHCEVIRHKGKYKILVRIDLIQRNVIVDIPLSNLMPLPASIAISA